MSETDNAVQQYTSPAAPEIAFGDLKTYKDTVATLIRDLEELGDYSIALNMTGNAAAIGEVVTRLREDAFNVAVIGEFRRGKSTFINALLGENILPTDILPTTAAPNKVTWAMTPSAKIEYLDGRSETIPIEQLKKYVTKLDDESEQTAKTVKMATVYYPLPYCKNNISIIDTPGLNDNAEMDEITLSMLPKVDAVIMVMMTMPPFSHSERKYLENKLMASDLGRVMFVVTGIDRHSEEEAERILRHNTKAITDAILTKAKNVYGEDSEEYKSRLKKLGNIRIHGLSAKEALEAKVTNDQVRLEKSRFEDFKKVLEKFLTEERGAVSLSVPVNRIKSSAIELMKNIRLREGALKMKREEFNLKYDAAMEEIKKTRASRDKECALIQDGASQTFKDLMPMIQDYWLSL
jgi:GTPase Era involved in 16S rRNA processing